MALSQLVLSTHPMLDQKISFAQLMFCPCWCCRIGDVAELQDLGLYLHDLSLHDGSRDCTLAGFQHVSRIEKSSEIVQVILHEQKTDLVRTYYVDLLLQQAARSIEITRNMRALDEETQKNDRLLYAMIPQDVAERLKQGAHPMSTCQV